MDRFRPLPSCAGLDADGPGSWVQIQTYLCKYLGQLIAREVTMLTDTACRYWLRSLIAVTKSTINVMQDQEIWPMGKFKDNEFLWHERPPLPQCVHRVGWSWLRSPNNTELSNELCVGWDITVTKSMAAIARLNKIGVIVALPCLSETVKKPEGRIFFFWLATKGEAT